MKRNLTNRGTLGGTCSMLRELMKVDEKGAFVSGQYAELVELLNIADKWYEGSVQRYIGLFAKAASALTTLTQQQKQHEDLALPVVNGGASTTASGTQDETAWLVELKLGWGTGNYWGGFSKDYPRPTFVEWVTVDKAIRFSRKQDAEAIAAILRDKERSDVAIEATEHMWVDVPHEEVDRTAPETSTRSADE